MPIRADQAGLTGLSPVDLEVPVVLVGRDAEFFVVLGDLFGVLHGVEGGGEEEVDQGVLLADLLAQIERVQPRDDVFRAGNLLEGLLSHPGNAGQSADRCDAAGRGARGFGLPVIAEVILAARMGVRIDHARQDVVSFGVDDLVSFGQDIPMSDGDDLLPVDRDAALDDP